MLKKMGIGLMASVLFLSGCFPFVQDTEDNVVDMGEEGDPQEQEVGVVPQASTAENFYSSVLYDGTYIHGRTRGFGSAVVYNRADLDQLELGLTEIAKEHFDPETYFFREGQFILRDELNSWLMRESDDNPNGLNPPLGKGDNMREREEDQPRYLSHILEHNYLVEDNGEYKLGGIVIGLSMNSVYNFRVEDDQGRYNFYETDISENKMLEEGEKIAQEVVNRLRSQEREDGSFNDIPIVIALFREQPRDSVIPGNFVATAVAEPDKELSGLQSINERYYLFPSDDANNNARNDSDNFLRFREEVQGFFESYVGIVGKGYYRDNSLQELTIDVPIRYQGKTEIVALSQFIADRIEQRFPKNIKVQVYINSVGEKQEAIEIGRAHV